MKKIFFILAGTILLSACSSTQMITFSKADLTDKDRDMIANNTGYSSASIVGGGADIIKREKEMLLRKQFEARKKKLQSIEGLTINTYKDENGREQFRATAQNEILFKFDSYELNENAIKMLTELCSVIIEIPETQIKIIGHTDNIGAENYNLTLSKNRASVVSTFLKGTGILPENIKEEGKGFTKPIADNKTEEGRARNRRVEILISNTAY